MGQDVMWVRMWCRSGCDVGQDHVQIWHWLQCKKSSDWTANRQTVKHSRTCWVHTL